MTRGQRGIGSGPGRAALFGAVLVLGLCVAGCGRTVAPPPPGKPNIILVTIDTLRADHLGCYGYFRDTSPNIDRLAGQAVLFERAYCPIATTLPSHASLLTGLSPLEHGIQANQEHGGGVFVPGPGARSIAQFLHEDGYATGAFVSATPVKRSSGLAAGFDAFDEPAEAWRRAEETTRPALDWIEENSGRPFFLWVHYYDPHWPRKPPQPFLSRYHDEPGLERFLAERHIPDSVPASGCKLATRTRPATNAYDGAIRYVDGEIGRLLEALHDGGLWDRSVVVIAADHGEGLNQHDWPAHGRTFEEQIHVPLMIRFPDGHAGPPRRVSRLVSLMDVIPTVLGRLDPSPAKGFTSQASGVDALAPDFQERPLLALRSARECGGEAGAMFALTTPEWKLVHDPPSGDRLFHRTDDPFELNDVLASRRDVAETLRAQLLKDVDLESAKGAQLASGRTGAARPLDPRVVEELKSLGYVDAAEPASQPAGHPQE